MAELVSLGGAELDGFDPMLLQAGIARAITSPDLLAALPARAFVEGFSGRLKAEDTLDVTMAVGFRFPDVGEAYAVEIRRGVAQFVEHLPEKTDLSIALDKTTLDRIRLGQLTMNDAIQAGMVQLGGGSPAEVARFFGYFEVPFSVPIRLVVR
jgi:alkyl sulfatase BDS1-like metallo-beta-lactamase superfamily hydrolase